MTHAVPKVVPLFDRDRGRGFEPVVEVRRLSTQDVNKWREQQRRWRRWQAHSSIAVKEDDYGRITVEVYQGRRLDPDLRLNRYRILEIIEDAFRKNI